MTCSDCRFHFEGACHRHSPQAIIVPSKMGQPAVIGVWPPTQDANWCGEYEVAQRVVDAERAEIHAAVLSIAKETH